MRTYPLTRRSNLDSLINALQADRFVECECELIEAADPAGELGNVIVGLARCHIDDFLEYEEDRCIYINGRMEKTISMLRTFLVLWIQARFHNGRVDDKNEVRERFVSVGILELPALVEESFHLVPLLKLQCCFEF